MFQEGDEVAGATCETRSVVMSDALAQHGIEFERGAERLVLRATRDLDGVGTGLFAEPAFWVDLTTEFDDVERYVGFGFAQFAMPVRARRSESFDWNPASNVFSPPTVVPLLGRCRDGSIVLAAPLDSWHEQVIAVDQTEIDGVRSLRWGWHGDLTTIPAGFSSSLGLFHADSVGEAFAQWNDVLDELHGSIERYRDAVVHDRLSYWTDNGAAYWYRTEEGQTITESIAQKVDELDDLGVNIGAVELDSWFYPHEVQREIREVGYLEEVPPSGMLEWTPRPTFFPDGLQAYRGSIGGRPLILHSRHVSPSSPYVDDSWWTELTAQPQDPSFFARWLADAASWGATCVEQDWMLMYWFGARQLREVPGRADAWLAALNDAARDHDLSLIFCMSTPGNLMAARSLDRVTAIRTCDDYRFAEDPARLWRWYLTVNHLAHAFGIPSFKDCFFSNATEETSIDGDRHAHIEAMLSLLSNGPVGIGDRIGCTDPELLASMVDADGLLQTADEPLRLCDQSFFDDDRDLALTWAETSRAGERHVLALHLADSPEPISGHLVGHPETTCTLGPREFAHFIVRSPEV